MNERCEVNVAPFCDSPDDPRYQPCGRPARFKVGTGEDETWMCAGHYDDHVRLEARIYSEESEDL
jgi:hypothetical protein